MDGKGITRRAALGALGGAAVLWGGFSINHAFGRWEAMASRPRTTIALPSWVSATPRSRRAYEAAYAQLELLATLPCYCGCALLPRPHASLRECFREPGGAVERHAVGCETCQDEALDAVRWADAGLPWSEIHRRIVAAYSERGPSSPGQMEAPRA